MNMRSRLSRVLVAAVAACAFSAAVFAGAKTGQVVTINDAKSQANGDMGYVRNTANSVEMIHCYINGSGQGQANGVCMARNSAGVTRSCSTNYDRWLTIIASITSDSNVYFRWDANGKCTMIIIDNSSTFAPKEP
jgi:hypothetical protein